MNDWINAQTWTLQDALEFVFLKGVVDSRHRDHEDFIDFAMNYLKGEEHTKRPSIVITTAQILEIKNIEKFLKNSLPGKNAFIEMRPIVWIKLGIHYLAHDKNRHESVFEPLFSQRFNKKNLLKEFYVIRNCEATDITSDSIKKLINMKILIPLDAFLLAPLPKIISHATEWKLIFRKSISLKFESFNSLPSAKKTKRERLGIKYYDKTRMKIEEILSNITHRKISKERVTIDSKYTFNGTRAELLNILRKKNHDSFPVKYDYKAIDVISDLVDCRLKK